MSSTRSATFSLRRSPLDLCFRRAHLADREWITATTVRVRLAGEDLDGFESPGADDHLRLFFLDEADRPATVEEVRSRPSREYTPVDWGRSWLDLEFVIHAHAGAPAPGSHWARSAPAGSRVVIGGPRSAMVVDGEPDGWFLAGDETAVPAIRRFLAAMPAQARGRVLVESAYSAAQLRLAGPYGVDIEMVPPAAGRPTSALIARLEAMGPGQCPAGAVFVFIAAEQAIVQPARQLVVDRWGIDPDDAVIKGYWKLGTAEYHAPH